MTTDHDVMCEGLAGVGGNAFSLSGRLCVSRDLKDFKHTWPRSDNMHGARGYIFQCADILEVWLDTIGRARQTEPFFVLIKNEHNEPWLALALGIERRSGVRVLTFLDGGVSDYNAPLLLSARKPTSSLRLDDLVHELRGVMSSFDAALFEKMPTKILDCQNPLVHPQLGASPESGHVMTLTGTWEEYRSKRAGKRQRKRKSMLEKAGRAVFTIAEDRSTRQRILAAMMRQKSRRYIETRGWDGFDRPGYRRYFPQMTERLSSTIHVSALELDGRIIATNWGMLLGQRFYILMPSFDKEYQELSPGRLLTEYLIEWSYRNGLNALDFGVGDQIYKLKYCDTIVPLVRTIIPVNPVGATFRSAVHCKEILRRTRFWGWLQAQISRAKSLPWSGGISGSGR
jgi:CelD/BcsL family acetyltransferase involved in cellulose biosynthesis